MAENIEPKPEIKFSPGQSFEQDREQSESIEQHSAAPPVEVELDDSERQPVPSVEQSQLPPEVISVVAPESPPPISTENEQVKERLMEGVNRSHPAAVSKLMEMINGTSNTPEDSKK